ncbi:EAL domain-containing protein [Plantactinospora sp. KLBMP9567]|uniref:EAL domain-containing protein n=1 Tax=Plantactinospora sp. KLBMP9567 TaxID=3085900 RepID=UPI0029824E8D|nr:EAL domain-containing protein [Plantactinospora sp. KLBMP9567]MDW5326189.1 EAL domain-containing protein [Plantactinospora sp. KLBMP9567]
MAVVDGPTIGVLTMSVGCDYFGSILGGIARTTAAAGGRMIAIQTLGAGTFDFDPPEPPDFPHLVAWDHVSAFVVILNSASPGYLNSIQRAGKPVIMISHEMAGVSCPVVLPDNRGGVREAVLHLVEHGHREIAFAGYLELRDLRERYEAYRDALLECGITPRTDLHFDTGDNRESGGERAGRAMLAAGLPSTAVVAGNDLNAIGLLRTFLAAGVQVPDEQAVVGFDDMEGVVYFTPSLSTVRQSFEDLGRIAAELALRATRGEEVEARTFSVPTSFQARESCGCPDPLAPVALAAEPDADLSTADHLVARLVAALPAPVDPPRRTTITRACALVADTLAAAADGAAGPDLLDLRQALVGLQTLSQRHPEGVVRMMDWVRRYGLGLARRVGRHDQAGAERVRAGTEEIVVALAQSRSRTHKIEENEFQTTLKTLYTVSKNLLRSHEKDPRALAWIQDTNARGGCLGLWSGTPAGGDTAEPALDLVTMFERDRGPVPMPVGPVPPRSFPPPELVDLADLDADQMVYVAPLRIGTSDWGMLAVVGPIEAEVASGREMMNQWAALLTIALDHDAVLKSLREQEDLLRHAALYDPLTGLANRTLFLDRLQAAVAAQTRHPERHYSVLLLDLDGFKLVNDSLGHLAGDRLLVQVAERIRASAREADVAARFGGDEFAVLLRHRPGGEDPVAVAERIRGALDVPFRLGEEEFVVSASIGISRSSTGYQHAEDVIRDADTAMYSAKWQRKGSHAVFDVAMHERVVGRLRTEAELRRALETGGFELRYQPIVRLNDGRTRAFEALVRWRHPVRGLVLPAEFLPIAEESGLMPSIGRWALTEACRQLGVWRASGSAPNGLRMSVNVSNRQFWHTRLLEDIEESLRAAGLDPAALIIEITEGVIVHDVPAARTKLAALHELGVQLHIDDFGTGYSSLQALHHLTIDAFKIDRSFVAPLATDGKSRELVRSIVSMGLNLGLELVAEGIETAAQRDQLRRYGCHHGQGYLFAGPVTGAEAEAILRDGALVGLPRLAARAVR